MVYKVDVKLGHMSTKCWGLLWTLRNFAKSRCRSTTYSVTAAAYATITRKASNYAHTFIRLFNNPLGNNTALTVTIQFNITKPGKATGCLHI